ncbi:hypothetical protein UK23_16455 [Lentzea aerocolonigenes]|uniref:Uncharacterized protein n=1 Tax=Lentzea aerocolonigenes TaxID=68170 RepID=A0A0F0H192_LENAE|nr:hypothetical protein UK23_16455 [Lentzea aerocolonigenes]
MRGDLAQQEDEVAVVLDAFGTDSDRQKFASGNASAHFDVRRHGGPSHGMTATCTGIPQVVSVVHADTRVD